MIVYIKENMPKINLSKLEFESPVEKDDEEEATNNPQDESELPLEI